MKFLAMLGSIIWFGWLGAIPTAGHDCGHRSHHRNDCSTCVSVRPQGPQARRGPSPVPAALQTLNGRITEVIYLPGTTADNGMVEIRLQASSETRLVRLAPSGVLKQGGLLLREGDTVEVRAYAVTALDGVLVLIATEVRQGEKALSLRDSRGQSDW